MRPIPFPSSKAQSPSILTSTSRVWDTSTGQCLRTLVHEDNPGVANVCFSPNARFVLAFTLDNCVRLWDYVAGSVKKTYQGHRNERFAVGGCFGTRRRYLQYLEHFDAFAPASSPAAVRRDEKLTDQYFRYLGLLAEYLESFMRRTRPLENVDEVVAGFDRDFDAAWESGEVEGWESPETNGDGTSKAAAATTSTAEAVYCEDCEKEFKNENVYRNHLSGRKHIKAAERRAERRKEAEAETAGAGAGSVSSRRTKERAVAEREHRIRRLAAAMSTERSDTRGNVERKQGMTERERQQELENLMNLAGADQEGNGANGNGNGGDEDGDEDDEGDERIYNPLKLPLAWDGKPIPFWLYRLHGLGVEFPCEICGNFVYMGRRAYDKHFNEARHVYGLRCLGITNTTLFRDISHIEEAMRLWEKIQREEKRNKVDEGSVVQMEDAEGNVMPEKVYYDLQKQGLL